MKNYLYENIRYILIARSFDYELSNIQKILDNLAPNIQYKIYLKIEQ